MKLGIQVGLGLATHILLDRDPAPPSPKGAQSPNFFGPSLLCPNGWMDQDDTWRGGGPLSGPHCARWGPSSPPQKGGKPQFSAHFYCGQTSECMKMLLGMEVSLSPGYIVLDGDLAPGVYWGVYVGIRRLPTSRLFCRRILTSAAIYEQGIRGLYAVLSPSK